MGRSPLDHPRLAIIEKKLDAGELDEAQHLLSQLGENYFFRHATTYLASRLLYLRGTLDEAGLVERLKRLVNETPEFPEAEALLNQARSGSLAHGRTSRPPPLRSRPPKQLDELPLGARTPSEARRRLINPNIPRAGRVPSLVDASDADEPEGEVETAPRERIPDLVPGHSQPPPGFGVSARREPSRVAPDVQLSPPPMPGPVPEAVAEDPNVSRYAALPDLTEEVQIVRQRAPAPRPSAPAPARTPPRAPFPSESLIGAEEPPARVTSSLFDIATLLDRGEIADALQALEARGAPEEPEHALMAARVYARAGRSAEARELCLRLGRAPLLDPLLRAGVARLALDLGEEELAFEQSDRAHEEDPTQPTVRLTFAWAALRRARRTAEPDLVSRASLALRELVGDGGPHEGLLLALRAAVEAHAGDAERALRLAERSLELEPSADGHAALAMAAARLGRADEAKRASVWLRKESPVEAKALEESLSRHGDSLFDLRAKPESMYAPAGSAELEASSVWGPLEHSVIHGEWESAWNTFSQLALDTIAQMSATARHEAPALAAVAASFLTVAPVSRELAPFDQTPWSLERLEELLSLFGRANPKLHLEHPFVVLLGAYVGETLRHSFGARWEPGLEASGRATVRGSAGTWQPLHMVADVLARTRRLGADTLVVDFETSGALARPHLPAVTPICPWDPAPWPSPSRLGRYALALEHSVIAQLCRQRTGRALDGTRASLHALDDHLDRIAPRRAPLSADPTWARRIVVLAGAYLGEVMRREIGGAWLKAVSRPSGPDSYVLRFGNGRDALPVQHVHERIARGAVPLHEWASRWFG